MDIWGAVEVPWLGLMWVASGLGFTPAKMKTKESYKIDNGVVWVTSFKGLQVTVRHGVGITTAGGVDEGA